MEGEAGVYCIVALLGRLQKKDDVVYDETYLLIDELNFVKDGQLDKVEGNV